MHTFFAIRQLLSTTISGKVLFDYIFTKNFIECKR